MDIYLLVSIAIGLCVAMSGAWAIQRATGLSGWIDTIWSLTVGAGGITAAIFADGGFSRRSIVIMLIALWSLRLASHIGARTTGAKEDPRYEKFIKEWGHCASWQLFVFLQMQAVAAFVLVLAVYLAAANDEYLLRPLDFLALAVGFIGLGGEALSDAQLARFRKSPGARTGVCEVGLWRYSRHPNYFFEWLFWCCLPLFALAEPIGSWLSLLAPIMMYWLLVHVSGIPPLEDHMLRSRGAKFVAVQQRVNAFFPGLRRESSSKSNGDVL
ncbi:steroid 5-alpha reductase family enzyme [Rhizobium leguminosarum]|nr:steroid 5-alpha reductase family enzyme [Rhizobium leguminosarum]MBB6219879.1 steroid 5-alpha reductase family enzyme [Rhizobium leguminosarum]